MRRLALLTVGFVAVSLLVVFAPLIVRLAVAHFVWIKPYLGTITLWRCSTLLTITPSGPCRAMAFCPSMRSAWSFIG